MIHSKHADTVTRRATSRRFAWYLALQHLSNRRQHSLAPRPDRIGHIRQSADAYLRSRRSIYAVDVANDGKPAERPITGFFEQAPMRSISLPAALTGCGRDLNPTVPVGRYQSTLLRIDPTTRSLTRRNSDSEPTSASLLRPPQSVYSKVWGNRWRAISTHSPGLSLGSRVGAIAPYGQDAKARGSIAEFGVDRLDNTYAVIAPSHSKRASASASSATTSRRVTGSQKTSDGAAQLHPTQQGRTRSPGRTLTLDGVALGRFTVQHLERALSKVPNGMTSIDPRASNPRGHVSPF